MKLFLAGSESGLSNAELAMIKQVPYILFSFYMLNKKNLGLAANVLKQAKIGIMDSGAFSFLFNGKEVEFSSYIEEYCRFIHDNRLKNYVELDMDGIWPLERIEQVRSDMEKAVGWPSMPCWHPERGLENLEKLCSIYNYIAIGGAHKIPPQKRAIFFKKLATKVMRFKRVPKIHLMGVQCREVFNLGFFSCDATSGLASAQIRGVVKVFGAGSYIQEQMVLRNRHNLGKICLKQFLKAVEYYDNYGGNEDV